MVQVCALSKLLLVMKIRDITTTSTVAWSHDVIPLLAAASVAGAVDLDFAAQPELAIWDMFGSSPIFSASVDAKFHALTWLKPFDGHPQGLLAGALETGAIEFWDVATMLKTQDLAAALVHRLTRHAAAKAVLFNPLQPHVMALGGLKGEIFVWDCKTFAEPQTPGRAMAPVDEVLCVAWNNAVPHILALTLSAGYTSIWDLKAKREVLHLSYPSADFSAVAWHPTVSTKLVTASQSDACPLIMTWDLRNATEPEKVLLGHTKGVLALDWCAQDPALLLSCGKDNSTRLWNPETGVRLGEYPPAGNWTFLAAFAPRAPDVFVSASFDGTVSVQTLQDTSPPPRKVEASEDDFWSTIASADTHHALFEVRQAPRWMQRPCSASFGFGLKLVRVTNSGKPSVSISTFGAEPLVADFTQLTTALKTNDFADVLAARSAAGGVDSADWEALEALLKHGKAHFVLALVEQVPNGDAHDDDAKPADDLVDDENFFASLASDVKASRAYVPSGTFTILDGSELPSEERVARLVLSNRIPDAVSACLDDGRLLEALVLALDSDDSVKAKVRNHFFLNNSDKLSRLIYSAASKNVVDIVTNADISNWKLIASSVGAYCDDDEFNKRVVELGDRILASGDAAARSDALKCYLAGSALDKVAVIWLNELPAVEAELLREGKDGVATPFDAHYVALGVFAEKISVYRSLSNLSGPLSGPSAEPVCRAVFEFCNMAAAGGHFELADQFMSLLPEDLAGVKAEKERIARATGAKQEPRRRSGLPGINGAAKPRYMRPSNSEGQQLSAAPTIESRLSHSQGRPSPARVPPRAPSMGVIPQVGASGAHSNAALASGVVAPTAGNPYVPSYKSFTHAPDVALDPRPPSTGPAFHTGSVRPPATPTFMNNVSTHNLGSSLNLAKYGAPPTRSSQVASPQAPPNPSFKVETEGWNDLPDTFKNKAPVRRTPAASAVVPPPSPQVSATITQFAHPPKRPSAQNVPPPPKSRVSSKPSAPGTPVAALASPRQISSNKYAPPPSAALNGAISAVSSPVVSSHPTSSGPPKNPYAPSANAPGPPKVSYAPPPLNNFAAPPPLQRTTSAQAVNPYTPPATITPPMGTLPPPPRSVSLHSSTPPLTTPVAQTFPPPPTRNGQSAQRLPQPPVATPPVPRKVSTPLAPPPRASAPPVSAPPVSAPPVSAPPISGAQPPIAPTRAPASYAPSASTPPISEPKIPAPPVASADLTAPPAASSVSSVGGTSPEVQPILDTFSGLLSHIKTAAPPKYAKHVADMEKRLGILFTHLNKHDLLSGETIELLGKTATSLAAKDYSAASAANQQISDNFSAEAGDWLTGVKRLVTMAEAFD